MAEVGFITAAEAEAARKKPDRRCAASRRHQPSVAPVLPRRGAQGARGRYGAKQLYENGLVHPDRARRPAAGGGQPRARTTGLRRDRQAPRLPQAAPQRRSPRATRSRRSSTRAGIGRCTMATSCRRSCRSADAAAIDARAGALRVTIDKKGFALDVQDTPAPAGQAGRSDRGAARSPSTRAAQTATGGRSSSRRWSKGRSSRSTTAPARSRRWSAATASSAASSIARPRPAAGRVGVQADRLHRGDRSRLHAGIAHRWTRR